MIQMVITVVCRQNAFKLKHIVVYKHHFEEMAAGRTRQGKQEKWSRKTKRVWEDVAVTEDDENVSESKVCMWLNTPNKVASRFKCPFDSSICMSMKIFSQLKTQTNLQFSSWGWFASCLTSTECYNFSLYGEKKKCYLYRATSKERKTHNREEQGCGLEPPGE